MIIQKDKICHAMLGIIICLVSYDYISFLLNFSIALIIAIGIELYDIKTTGFSYKDIVATMVGWFVTLGLLEAFGFLNYL